MAVISMKNVINAVNDDTEIEIYKGDQLLAKGNWYHSQILKYGEEDVVEADWDCLNNKCKVKICGAKEKTFYKFCVGKICVNRTGPYMSYRASANNALEYALQKIGQTKMLFGMTQRKRLWKIDYTVMSLYWVFTQGAFRNLETRGTNMNRPEMLSTTTVAQTRERYRKNQKALGNIIRLVTTGAFEECKEIVGEDDLNQMMTEILVQQEYIREREKANWGWNRDIVDFSEDEDRIA